MKLVDKFLEVVRKLPTNWDVSRQGDGKIFYKYLVDILVKEGDKITISSEMVAEDSDCFVKEVIFVIEKNMRHGSLTG